MIVDSSGGTPGTSSPIGVGGALAAARIISSAVFA